MATTGCDLASVDEDGDPSWQTSEAEGHLRFVGLRAAEGLTPDPSYATYRRQLDAVRIPNFPYLFLTPGLETPEAQVDVALVAIGTFDRDYFPLALDVEGSRRGLTARQWRDWVVRARDHVRAAIGVDPLIYTSHIYWADPSGMDNLAAPQLSDCLGWWKYWPIPVDALAVYDPNTVDRLAPPPAPTPWGDQWGIQQYQGDAHGYPGFRSTVDLDRLHVVTSGEHGDTVRWIQRRLPGVDVDGAFGPKTQAAVRDFQTSKGITDDGVVGLDTMQQLAWVQVRTTWPSRRRTAPSRTIATAGNASLQRSKRPVSETLVRAGGTVTPDVYMVTADQNTIVGNGTTADPLRVAPGTTASSLSVIFRPGGVATQNVFPTFEAAVEALSQTQGKRVLQFDDSLEPISIPSHPGGGAWPMLGIDWEGYPGRVVHVTLPEGTSFSNLRTIRGLRITFAGTTPPIADLGAPGAATEALLLDEGATITVSGGGPLLLLSHTAVLRLGGSAGVLTGTFAVISVVGINSLRITAEGPFSTLRDNTVRGDEDEFLLLEITNSAAGDTNGALSTTQVAFAGVIESFNATASRSYPTSIIPGGGSVSLDSASVTVLFDPTTGDVLIFLPPALGLEGRDVTAKNVTASVANDGIIVANGSDTIDGAVNAHVSGAHASATVRSNGKDRWFIVARV